jgi:hypothetical protein
MVDLRTTASDAAVAAQFLAGQVASGGPPCSAPNRCPPLKQPRQQMRLKLAQQHRLAGMITPIRKPQFRELLPWEKEFNKQVNKIRAVVERVIAGFKTGRIIHADYRRPLATFAATISAVIGLHFWREA